MKKQGILIVGLWLIGSICMSFSMFDSNKAPKSASELELSDLNEGKSPVVTIAGKTYSDRVISLTEVQELDVLVLEKPFLKKGYRVASFQLVFVEDGNIIEIATEGNQLSSLMKEELKKRPIDTKFSIEKINVKSPKGDLIKTPAFSFRITA